MFGGGLTIEEQLNMLDVIDQRRAFLKNPYVKGLYIIEVINWKAIPLRLPKKYRQNYIKLQRIMLKKKRE